MTAAQPSAADLPACSVVILNYNGRQLLGECLRSVLAQEYSRFEVLVVDNGSSDGTRELLADTAGKHPDMRTILFDENRGFPAAANQGIQAASGQQILLLNNDTIVTTGWLRRLLDAFDADPRIGLAGPSSNCVSGPQEVKTSYDDINQIDGFAWDWGRAHAGQFEDIDRLVGFCLLIRRSVK